MNFFKKFPGKRTSAVDTQDRLIKLLNSWGNESSPDNASRVVNEIMFGEAQLFLPILYVNKTYSSWDNLELDTILKVSSIVEYEGERVILAFTDSNLIAPWLNKPAVYTSMLSVNLLNACMENSIAKTLIYFGHPKPFILGQQASYS